MMYHRVSNSFFFFLFPFQGSPTIDWSTEETTASDVREILRFSERSLSEDSDEEEIRTFIPLALSDHLLPDRREKCRLPTLLGDLSPPVVR